MNGDGFGRRAATGGEVGRGGRGGPPGEAGAYSGCWENSARRALPPGALPLERLQVIVPAIAATDPLGLQFDLPAVIAAGRPSSRAWWTACPGRSPGRRPTPLWRPRKREARAPPGRREAGGAITERLWSRLSGRRPTAGLLRALSAALVLVADQELAASTLTARVAASVRADPYAVVATGLGAVGGALHGGASLGAENLLSAAATPADVPRVIRDLLRRGERVPGFGHFVYRTGDPRAALLLDRVRAAAARDGRLAVPSTPAPRPGKAQPGKGQARGAVGVRPSGGARSRWCPCRRCHGRAGSAFSGAALGPERRWAPNGAWPRTAHGPERRRVSVC